MNTLRQGGCQRERERKRDMNMLDRHEYTEIDK